MNHQADKIREWTIQYVNQSCSWWVISYPSGNEIERTSITPPFVHVVERITYEQLKAENDNLKKIISKEFNENDELGSEFVYVNILKAEITKLKGDLSDIFKIITKNRNPEEMTPQEKLVLSEIGGEM